MERLVASSDLWPDITVSTETGAEMTYPIGLELTYGFDARKKELGIAINGHRLMHASDPDRLTSKEVLHVTKDPQTVYVFVSNLSTAQKMVGLMGLPDCAAPKVREHLDAMATSLEPFVLDVFLGRATANEPAPPADLPQTAASEPDVPAPTVPLPDNVLVVIDRDVSGVFNKPSGTCVLEYTLFSEPKSFRAVIMVHKDGAPPKPVQYIRKDVAAIMSDLNSDNLAHQIASYFGEGNSRQVYMVSAVLKLGFAMNTGLARDSAGKAFAPATVPEPAPAPKPVQETVTLPKLAAVPPGTFTVFNHGEYFDVPNERSETR